MYNEMDLGVALLGGAVRVVVYAVVFSWNPHLYEIRTCLYTSIKCVSIDEYKHDKHATEILIKNKTK